MTQNTMMASSDSDNSAPDNSTAKTPVALRSLLFVPGDRPERFAKAAQSGADAIIIDLEDAVAPEKKHRARQATAEWLVSDRKDCPTFVRVNPQTSGETQADLDSVLEHHPEALLLPKAEGAASVRWLCDLMASLVACDAFSPALPASPALPPPILPVATETPAAIFALGSFGEVRHALLGLTWGAEDLPAAIGAVTAREENGRYTAPYEMARSLTLFAAHAAEIAAIDTVFPDISNQAGLAAYAARAARDGFTGMLAIHPAQVPLINAAFTPNAEQIAQAQAIVEAFAANPGAGALRVDGKMLDAPHWKAAVKLIERAKL